MVTKSHLSLLGQEKSNHNPTIWVGAKMASFGQVGRRSNGRGRVTYGKKRKIIISKQSYWGINLCERIATFQSHEGRGVNRGFK